MLVQNVWISDLDGLGSNQLGGQMLSDFQKLEKATSRVEVSPEVEAGKFRNLGFTKIYVLQLRI